MSNELPKARATRAAARRFGDDGFLQRWSARKEAARAGMPVVEEVPALSVPEAAASAPCDGAVQPAAPEVEPIDPATLPDIETLDASSDYTPFLRAGVPTSLRNAALRKLWRSDPVFANLDGLNDYEEDFRVAPVSGIVRTVYKVGRGFLSNESNEVSDDTSSQNTPGDSDSGEVSAIAAGTTVDVASRAPTGSGEAEGGHDQEMKDTDDDMDVRKK